MRCLNDENALHHDPGCNTLFGSDAERRVRLETAEALIDPEGYSLAEEMYEADTFEIACELGVTVQVIEDYRRWLETHFVHSNHLDERVAA